MITARIASLNQNPAIAAVAAIPGDWPGPALSDLQDLTQVVVA
jgi:hypothetical protein